MASAIILMIAVWAFLSLAVCGMRALMRERKPAPPPAPADPRPSPTEHDVRNYRG